MKVRPFTKDDKDSLVKMVKYCFNMSQKDSEHYIQGALNFCKGFVAEEGGVVLSAMFYIPFHQNIHNKKFKWLVSAEWLLCRKRGIVEW